MARKTKKPTAAKVRRPTKTSGRRARSDRRAATTASAKASRSAGDLPAELPLLVPTDPSTIPSLLAELDEDQRAALRQRLGPAAAQRLFRTARGWRGHTTLGRVVVLHGIMGANLESRVANGNWERVWVNYWRLAKGRLRDLELDANGRPIPGSPAVRVEGLYEDYLPLVAELQQNWDVLPFAYDWRADIDESADLLAAAVADFAQGGPVHLVAHSMGGLVARRFSQRHPDLWRAIDDPAGHRTGGRLIQLGTPNRGSFAISLFLTGEEKIVKQLALLDIPHGKAKVVSFLRGFPGSYQMLPPPDARFDDDRGRLQDGKEWGAWPVSQALVDRGRAFQDSMATVVDPERLVYLAGYDQDTPDRVRIKREGEFEYRITRAGDGRVPHDLGLLADVRTFYVRAAHGDLVKDDQVLNGIHELLQQGTSKAVDDRAMSRSLVQAKATWHPASTLADVGPEFERLRLVRGVRRGRPAVATLTTSEVNQLQQALGRSALGSAATPPVSPTAPATGTQAGRPVPKLVVYVAHGDITHFAADLYAVGHYQHVLPQNAELALDRVISKAKAREDEMVLRRDSRSGLLNGELGSVALYPWRALERRLVAVVGMGSPGTFGLTALRRVGQSLAFRALHLPNVAKVATVLIGSGEGNLTPADAVRALLTGAADALGQYIGDLHVEQLVFVERDAEKAEAIAEELRALRDDQALRGRLQLEVHATKQLRRPPKKQRSARIEPEHPAAPPPTRLSWMRSDLELRVSALTSSAVVPERAVSVDLPLIDELVARMYDPPTVQAAHDGALLGQLVVPRDFRLLLGDAKELIVEVDRYTAGMPWEMLSLAGATGAPPQPFSVQIPFARQLRTTYSPAPSFERISDRPLRILIVGDPGDPDQRAALPGARREALAVRQCLLRLAEQTGLQLEVVARIGAPSVERRGELIDIPAASRLDVLDLLMNERWDILHYCGHGDFDPDRPDRVGWTFASGLLTAHELQQMDIAPRLVVANACLSARTSDRLRVGKRSSDERTEADLLPSLADEFFHRGVRNYIGTAWEVDDEGAIWFAKTFYERLLGESTQGSQANTIGTALREARQLLFGRVQTYDSLWAAYQHYGDPQQTIGAHREPPPKRKA